MRFFFFLLIFAIQAEAQERASVEKALQESICFLQNAQESEDSEVASKGEWPSLMSNEQWTPFLGPKGKSAIDFNNFTTASVAVILGEANQVLPDPKIPLMLKQAGNALTTYEENDQFYFWKKLDKTKALKRKTLFKNKRNEQVRRPTTFELKSKFINNLANIPADTDDTALSFLAYKYINNQGGEPVYIPPASPEKVFTNFRDLNRQNAHFMNVLDETQSEKGAYLTWLKKEKMFSPWMWIPSGRKENITFGTNDVDCVVNSNILTTLTEFNQTDSEGYKAACDHINQMFLEKKSKVCGIYYPSPHNLHYSAAKAYHHGARCLGPSMNVILDELKVGQKEDGSFPSDLKDDDAHNTLYALNALLLIGNEDLNQTKSMIEKSMKYVLSQKKSENGCSHWQGGAFFSGGTIIRKSLIWRSDAYTTALATQAFSHYLKKRNDLQEITQPNLDLSQINSCIDGPK